jgi:nitronate monooxygenase
VTASTTPWKLRLPLIGAPMFIVSSQALVIAQCRAGILGAFPALNARPEAALREWLQEISAALGHATPYAVNLIVHPSNPRLAHDLEAVCEHRVPVVITSLNPPGQVVERVHAYGGKVLQDVSTVRHARRAAADGVDGLILVCAGAGGHTGTLSPFAFIAEVREFFAGTVVLAGALTHGRHVLAAQAMGADYAYVGTRFIASEEANADPRYKQMIVEGKAADIVTSSAVTGLKANYLSKSFEALGLDPEQLPARDSKSFSFAKKGDGTDAKAWRDVWSAGQGIGAVDRLEPAAAIVDRLYAEYEQARSSYRPA